MIINFSNIGSTGGGSGSAVTPADVQSAITTALEPYWDSAATEDAISAATAGKADKSNVTPNTNAMQFPLWNGDGVITGTSGTNVYNRSVIINGNKKSILRNENSDLTPIFAPQTVGTPGYQVVAKADGTAGWDNPLSAYTPTTDFATVNGSAITNGGNIVIEGGSAADAALLKHITAFPASAETGDVVAKVTEGEPMLSWTFPGEYSIISASAATVTNTFNWNDFPMNTPYTIASWTSVGNHQMEVVAKRQVKTQNGVTWEEITLYLYADDEEVKYGSIALEYVGINDLGIDYEEGEGEYFPNGDFKVINFGADSGNTSEEKRFVVFASYGEEYADYTESLIPVLNLQSFGPASGGTMGVYQYDGTDWGEVKPDLSAYYTSAETQAAIAQSLTGYYTSGQTDEILAGYYTKSETNNTVGAAISALNNAINDKFTGYYTSGQTQDAINAQSIADKAYTDNKLTGYYTSAQTDDILTGYTPLADYNSLSAIVQEQQIVFSSGYTELHADFDKYYTSAQTEDAIASALTDYALSADVTTLSAATAGKADAANISAANGIPNWNSQGIITGANSPVFNATVSINGKPMSRFYGGAGSWNSGDLYAPESAGTAGDILVSTGNGAPVWSAVTIPDMTNYTPTTGFSTINGSAITAGGNLVIEGGSGPDMSAYWTSAETKGYVDTTYSSAVTRIDDVELVMSSALNEFHTQIVEISGNTPDLANYYTSAQTDTAIATAIADYTPTTGFSTINGSAITAGGNLVIEGGSAPDLSAYWTSAETETAISTATAGKANAANVTPNTYYKFPFWNAEGIITGVSTTSINNLSFNVNGNTVSRFYGDSTNSISIYSPTSKGNAGEFLVADGTYEPKWSAVTIPDMSEYYTSAQTDTAISTATANMVESTSVSTLWKGTTNEYNTITQSGATADPNTFYIIVANNN